MDASGLYCQLKQSQLRGDALEICGEAMNGLYKAAPAIAKKIPYSRDIIGFRNIPAHGYAEIDHGKVYDIAVRHAPDLLAPVKEALKEFSEPQP